MTIRFTLALLTTGFVLPPLPSTSTQACCPAGKSGRPVVNADQTVIIIWDAEKKTQHFIRKASFESQSVDFGFLVPSPTEPDLQESGNDAFPYLQELTEPEVKKMQRPASVGCGCGSKSAKADRSPKERVKVLLQKDVAGFNAAVLESTSSKALVRWLKDNGYAYSPEIEAWSDPYIKQGWKITALKVAKKKDEEKQEKVTASALRMSFKTDKPLFPYREPDPKSDAKSLGASHRMLRIYFLADGRYEGRIDDKSWSTAKVAWADKLNQHSKEKVLTLLKLPKNTGPTEWWLTEFEDNWPYEAAAGDVYFSKSSDQRAIKRDPIIVYTSSIWPTDVTVYAIAMALVVPPMLRRRRKQPQR